MSTEKSPDNDPKELPLVSHLVELRDRLLRCVICVLVVFLALYAFSDQIFHFVFTPLSQALTEGQAMITTKPLDSFFIPLMMTLMVAFFISIPYVMHQVWAFVAPGLYQNEIKVTLPILISSIVLFYVGIAFARFLVLPLIFNFAVNAAPDEVQVMNAARGSLHARETSTWLTAPFGPIWVWYGVKSSVASWWFVRTMPSI